VYFNLNGRKKNVRYCIVRQNSSCQDKSPCSNTTAKTRFSTCPMTHKHDISENLAPYRLCVYIYMYIHIYVYIYILYIYIYILYIININMRFSCSITYSIQIPMQVCPASSTGGFDAPGCCKVTTAVASQSNANDLLS